MLQHLLSHKEADAVSLPRFVELDDVRMVLNENYTTPFDLTSYLRIEISFLKDS
jgi:hypothetical protein